MKIEISKDQNTLTVDGVEYEAKLNEAKPHQPVCKTCVFSLSNQFCEIATRAPQKINPSKLRLCESPDRNDGKSIFWIKKEVEQMTEAPAPAPAPPMKKLKVKIELDRNEFEIEAPYDARPQEVDKAILDMATQFMVVTQEII